MAYLIFAMRRMTQDMRVLLIEQKLALYSASVKWKHDSTTADARSRLILYAENIWSDFGQHHPGAKAIKLVAENPDNCDSIGFNYYLAGDYPLMKFFGLD